MTLHTCICYYILDSSFIKFSVGLLLTPMYYLRYASRCQCTCSPWTAELEKEESKPPNSFKTEKDKLGKKQLFKLANTILNELLQWLCQQMREASHSSRERGEGQLGLLTPLIGTLRGIRPRKKKRK